MPTDRLSLRTVRAAVAVAVLLVAGLTAGASASDNTVTQPSVLCRAIGNGGAVARLDSSGWHWIYTIPAGHDMRVYRHLDQTLIYGHGAGHTQNGWAYRSSFGTCRPG